MLQKQNVRNTRIRRGIFIGILIKSLSSTLSKRLPSPFTAPHKINVQFAPCQIPLTKNTTMTLAYVRAVPLLLPPSGI